jgi:two-component sensor histidine kinase/integral membrane sensor domain MASE1
LINSAEENLAPGVFQDSLSNSIRSRSLIKEILLILVLAGIYYFAARFSLTLAFRETNASPFWPPTGIAFASVMLFGYRISPGIALGAFFANFLTGLSPIVSLTIAIGNTLEAVVGLYLFKRLSSNRSIADSIRSVLIFLVPVAMGSSMISASIGATDIYAAGFNSGASLHYVWWTWWLGDTVGNIVVAPLILSIASFVREAWTLKVLQAFVILLLSSAGLSFVVFGPSFHEGHILVYSTLIIIVVAAFNLPLLGITILSAFISMFAVWGTISGFGPFVLQDRNESLLFLQLYIGIVAATGLILCATLNERKKALRDMHSAEQQAKLMAAEKSVLLQELNHRVKNNLQIIISLLNIHKNELASEEGKSVFKECINRVIAINNVHQSLFQAAQPDFVDLSEYLNVLAMNLVNTYRSDPSKVKIEIQADKVAVHHEKAIPLGMILNELMVNSMKHAFHPQQEGIISITLKRTDHRILFSYSDSGRGVEETQKDQASSIGMQLINLLTRQIGGTVQSKISKGATYLIEFPIEQFSERP